MQKRVSLSPKTIQTLLILLELAIVAGFAIWFCRPWLNMDPNMWPTGGIVGGAATEYAMVVRGNAIWQTFQQCGLCFLWNGSLRGGYPAFAEMQGSVFHPFVVFFTLIAGVSNGVKLVLVASFVTAGLAQWWIGYLLGLRPLARVWAGFMAVAAGTLATRMALGVVGIILSTSMAALAIAAAMYLAKARSGRAGVVFALSLAMLLLAGQAYVQVGFVLVVPLSLLALLVDPATWKLDRTWLAFLKAGLLALMLCAFTLLPVARLTPELDKFSDPGFSESQPAEYVPVNLIASDEAYLTSNILKPLPYADRAGNYIGWVPVLLAVYAFRVGTGPRSRWLWFLALGTFLSIIATSGLPLKWLIPVWPGVQTIRFPHWIAGITVIMLLGLAGMGLDGILGTLVAAPAWLAKALGKLPAWLQVRLAALPTGWASAAIMLAIMAAPLMWSVRSVVDFSSQWVGVSPAPGEIALLDRIPAKSAYWLGIDEFSHFWNLPIVERGLKMGHGLNPMMLKGRELPPIEYLVITDMLDQPDGPILIDQENLFKLYWYPGNHYAFAMVGEEKVACPATATGGVIEVECDLPRAGQLFVTENIYDGWRAWVDGKPTDLANFSKWLSVPASTGKHHYSFRFWPWDVPLGLALGLAGCWLALRWWRGDAPKATPKNHH